MQRIRIKTAPKLGDQVDYSFYDSRNRNTGMAGNKEEEVKNTMGPIPREEATIEVERGEVVVGDTNEDGFLELFTFGGKPHSQGGTPVDVPPGSFIYSNTRKLRIKDKDVLTKVFGLNEKKGGYTPAEIAKRYQINEHVATLKDEKADSIQKRSASEMLKNNLDKLGVLALVQESMKGFPDGIPAIAESAAIGMGMDPAMFDPAQQQMQQGQPMPEQMPMAKYGGLPKYQNAGQALPTADQISYTPDLMIYINGQPHRLLHSESEFNTFTPNNYVFEDVNTKNKFYINEHEFKRSFNQGTPVNRFYGDQYLHYNLGSTPEKGSDWYSQNEGLDVNGKRLRKDSVFFLGNDLYKVEWPYAAASDSFGSMSLGIGSADGSGASKQAAIKATKVEPIWENGKVVGYDPKGNTYTKLISASDLKDADNNKSLSILNFGPPPAEITRDTNTGSLQTGLPPGAVPLGAGSSSGATDDLQNRALQMGWFTPEEYAASGWQANTQLLNNAQAMGWGNDIKGYRDSGWIQKAGQQSARPAATAPRATQKAAAPAGKPKTAKDALQGFAYGGSLPKYQPGSTVKPDPNVEQKVGEVTLEDGTKLTIFYKGDQKIAKNEKGEIVASEKRTDIGGKNFSQYGSQGIEQIIQSQPDVIYTNTQFGTFGRQNRLGNTGIYLSSNNAKNRAEGNLSPEEWQDFYNRHGDWIDQSYQSPNGNGKGFEAFKKDLLASETSGKQAAGWFQDQVNQFSEAEFNTPYFAKQKSSENPYTRDALFGQVTYSVPRFFKRTAPATPPAKTQPAPPAPGMKKAYYCVEQADGSRSVQEVEYPENSAPTAPTGKTVSAYNSRAEADAGCVKTAEKFEQAPIKRNGPWWAQDILTFTNAMTQGVNKYEPMLQQLDLLTSEYTPLKKDAQVANIQQMQNQFMNLAQNSNDGNVATAAALAASGDSFQNSANAIAQIENQNSVMSTTNSKDNTAIENQERLANPQLRGQYVGQSATTNQQMDNANRALDTNRMMALRQGMTNWGNKKWQEQVMTPEVYIDPILYDVEFSGKGRDYSLPDLYQNPYFGGTGAGRGGRGSSPQMTADAIMNDADIELYDKYYKALVPKYGEEQAQKIALQKMQQYNSMIRSNPAASQYLNPSAMTYPGGFTPQWAAGGAITVDDLFYMLNHAKKR